MAAEQLSLLGHSEPNAEAGDFASVRRISLDASSWIDYGSRFLAGHEGLFEVLRREVRFRAERRMMYEREVDVPRLCASLPDDGPIPAALRAVQRGLAARYAVPRGFEGIGLALYRGGTDSVAFHRDHMARDRPTLVAILSLGTPRKLLVRPFGGGATRTFRLGWGDLFVMGGMCQRDWEHGIPKQKHAQPRMSCVFRHEYVEA